MLPVAVNALTSEPATVPTADQVLAAWRPIRWRRVAEPRVRPGGSDLRVPLRGKLTSTKPGADLRATLGGLLQDGTLPHSAIRDSPNLYSACTTKLNFDPKAIDV